MAIARADKSVPWWLGEDSGIFLVSPSRRFPPRERAVGLDVPAVF